MKYSRKYIWQESKDYLGLLLGITIYAVGFIKSQPADFQVLLH